MMVRDGGLAQRSVALPVVGRRIDNDAFHRCSGVVARPPGGLAIIGFRNDHAAAIRIDQHLVGVEAQSVPRRPLNAVAVELARSHIGNEGVPVVIGAVGRGIEAQHAAGRASSSRSKSSSSTLAALRENRLKLTPPSTTVAPSGRLLPAVWDGVMGPPGAER